MSVLSSHDLRITTHICVPEASQPVTSDQRAKFCHQTLPERQHSELGLPRDLNPQEQNQNLLPPLDSRAALPEHFCLCPRSPKAFL